jgi:hypothetical protein
MVGTATSHLCPDIVPSNLHVPDPLKEALGGKRFRADDEVKTFCAIMTT